MKQLDKLNKLFLKRFRNVEATLPEYCNDITFDQLRFSGLPYLPLDIAVPVEKILQEILTVDLVAHRDDHGEHNGWHSFSIHGKSETATREDSYYNDNRPMQWTDKMPTTVKWFKDVYPADDFARVRVMRLDPGGYISIHSDTENSRLDPVNISITQPEGCDFVMEKHGLVPFTVGTTMWLDVSNRHTVINDSDKPRYHLIVHAKPNKDFEDIALKSYKKFYNKG